MTEMSIFVLDTEKKPLAPCHPAVARKLLREGKAAIFKRYPFTIILKEVKENAQPDFRLKIDPGSRVTGLAIVQESIGSIVWAGEIEHKGHLVKKRLEDRRSLRRNRRSRKTRYRKPRFLNRIRAEGWLPPSLESRIANTITWTIRIGKLCPLTAFSLELVKFDTQKMQNPEISGTEYQQGELYGYEIREYLLEKWNRTCAYCGKRDVPLQIEHIIPRSRGGTNRISNLTIACEKCNLKKGNKTAEEFGYSQIQQKARLPLKDAAAVNSTRWAVFNELKQIGLPIECSSGGRTKWNRTRLKLPKEHWIDAACVGESIPLAESFRDIVVNKIKAMGYGNRQICTTDKYGFPIRHRKREKSFMGFQTGDLVKAQIPKGKYEGVHFGRVNIRHRPSFCMGKMDVHPKYLQLIQRADGYGYG